MEDESKLSTEELKRVQEFNQRIQNLIFRIGNLEAQKLELYDSYKAVDGELKEFTQAIMKKYGEVEIDISTGVIREKSKD